ncbi:MAG: hypothetical protein ACRD2T_13420, partial [Thermoanaerobaculia bacterium]
MSVLLQFESKRSDPGVEPAPAGLQHATLGIGETGEVKLGEFVEETLGLVEAALEILGGGPQRRGIAGGEPSELGIGQERLAGGGIGSHA